MRVLVSTDACMLRGGGRAHSQCMDFLLHPKQLLMQLPDLLRLLLVLLLHRMRELLPGGRVDWRRGRHGDERVDRLSKRKTNRT